MINKFTQKLTAPSVRTDVLTNLKITIIGTSLRTQEKNDLTSDIVKNKDVNIFLQYLFNVLRGLNEILRYFMVKLRG